VINAYSVATAGLFPINDGIADLSGNPTLISSVRALGSLSRMKDQASQQQVILGVALAEGSFQPGNHAAAKAARSPPKGAAASATAAPPLPPTQRPGTSATSPTAPAAFPATTEQDLTKNMGTPPLCPPASPVCPPTSSRVAHCRTISRSHASLLPAHVAGRSARGPRVAGTCVVKPASHRESAPDDCWASVRATAAAR
jgi:hypothetical protein